MKTNRSGNILQLHLQHFNLFQSSYACVSLLQSCKYIDHKSLSYCFPDVVVSHPVILSTLSKDNFLYPAKVGSWLMLDVWTSLRLLPFFFYWFHFGKWIFLLNLVLCPFCRISTTQHPDHIVVLIQGITLEGQILPPKTT